jgi:hypothetical protein
MLILDFIGECELLIPDWHVDRPFKSNRKITFVRSYCSYLTLEEPQHVWCTHALCLII